jgi:hypothetical protein
VSTDPPLLRCGVDVVVDPSTVWSVIADPQRLSRLSPESRSVSGIKTGPARVGTRFSGSNRRGLHRWSTDCTVVESVPGEAFAFDVRFLGLAVARWRYVVSPTTSGSHVEEQWWDHRGRTMRLLGIIGTGVRDRRTHNEITMRATLAALKSDMERSET